MADEKELSPLVRELCALKDRGLEQRDVINAYADATPGQVARAREMYADGSDDEVEIDDEAMTSRADGENGTWVQAWVWLPDPEEED